MSIFWNLLRFIGLSSALDRRKAFRHIINIPADYSTSEEEAVYLFYNTVDISETGAFIGTLNPLPKGSLIDVDFNILAVDDESRIGKKISVQADVVHTITDEGRHYRKGPGMGIRFRNLDKEDWKLIEGIITGERMKKTVEIKITPEEPQDDSIDTERQIKEIRKQQIVLKKEVDSYTHEMEKQESDESKEEETILDEEELSEIDARISEGIPDEGEQDP